MKVVALAGGVGGAKMAHGLAKTLPPDDLSVIVNIGDDFEHYGLKICPDLDTVCYTLAGIANLDTGWGRHDETWHALETIKLLGGETWFHLGDKDMGLHLERTRRLKLGHPLSTITHDFCYAWGINLTVLPATDDSVPTWVYTDEGRLPFQEYFVHRRCQPHVHGFEFSGYEFSRPAPGVEEALHEADMVVICPSNPWVSIDPILAIPGIKQAISSHPVYAISPIIGGKTVKGPAAKMYSELGIQPTAAAVYRHYGSLLHGFIIDKVDRALAMEIQDQGGNIFITDTIMRNVEDRQRLAVELLEFSQNRL